MSRRSLSSCDAVQTPRGKCENPEFGHHFLIFLEIYIGLLGIKKNAEINSEQKRCLICVCPDINWGGGETPRYLTYFYSLSFKERKLMFTKCSSYLAKLSLIFHLVHTTLMYVLLASIYRWYYRHCSYAIMPQARGQRV